MPSKLIDEFVKSLCLGLEEMICCGMINLAAVGGREWRIPKRGVSVMTSNDSESEGDASSVSDSTSASTSFSISNLDRAASRIYVRILLNTRSELVQLAQILQEQVEMVPHT